MSEVKSKVLALSFDDGPNTGVMVKMLELLRRFDAKATFFVVGSNLSDASVPVLKQAIEQGHEIGNHSHSHSHMSAMENAQMLKEVNSLQERLERLTGVKPALFRPPYLDVNDAMLETIPMPFIGGSGNNDWDPDCTVDERVELALRSAGDGGILLMHCFDGNDAAVEAVGRILPELRRRGYRMVTVSRLFAEKGIEPQNGVLYQNVYI